MFSEKFVYHCRYGSGQDLKIEIFSWSIVLFVVFFSSTVVGLSEVFFETKFVLRHVIITE